jgi:hypothetical protein
MNREIKFRFWTGVRMVNHKTLVDDNYRIAQLRSSLYVAMQYTGLKDKNGVEIYEGDILENPSFKKRVVVWFENGFHAQSINNSQARLIPLSVGFLKNKEVVSNIHQNPELVNQ